MLEQDKRSQPARNDTTSPQTQQMTHLEGIRQKVYMDRYSLKDPSGQVLIARSDNAASSKQLKQRPVTVCMPSKRVWRDGCWPSTIASTAIDSGCRRS